MRYCHKNGLILTKIEEDDLPTLKQLKDESWFGTHTVAIVNMADQKAWFSKNSSCVLKVIDPEGLLIVGIFKIDNTNHVNRTCDVGWDVLSEHRGKGFGKKIVQAGVDFCFEVLNMNRLDAEILSNNEASQKCAYAAGFLREGCRREAVYRCSEYLDSLIFGILRHDWASAGPGLCNTSYTPKDKK